MLTPEALADWLEKGGRGGVFFLHGEDEFRKEEATRALLDAHLEPSTRDFNFDSFRGAELQADRFASTLSTPPLLAEWRVVLVREAEALASSARLRAIVEEFLERTPPGLALILAATIPARSTARFYRDLEARTKSVAFAEIEATDVPGWLMQWAKTHQHAELDEAAARALAEAVGTDLGVLTREVEKLASYAGGREITEEHVRQAGIALQRQNRWAWFDMVGERRFRDAVAGLRTLLAQGETGVGLTIGLGTQLLRIGVALESGTAGLERVLPGNQRWLARRILGQARRWSPATLAAALQGLLRVDQLLKASTLTPEHLLEEWLLAQLVVEATEDKVA